MGKSLAKGLFYAMATVLMLWTASLTFSFVSTVLPDTHWLVPLFALVVFDVGMIAWLIVYIDYAEGSGQRTVAMVACIFDFIGVGLMSFAEIFLGGQTLILPPANLGEFAVWGLGIWTVANVGAVIAFHLLDPETRKKTSLRSEMDKVFDEALEKLKTKRAHVSGQLSDELSEGMLAQLMADLATDINRDGVPDMFQAVQTNGGKTAPLAASPDGRNSTK